MYQSKSSSETKEFSSLHIKNDKCCVEVNDINNAWWSLALSWCSLCALKPGSYWMYSTGVSLSLLPCYVWLRNYLPQTGDILSVFMRNSLFPSDSHHDSSVINVSPVCVCVRARARVSRVISVCKERAPLCVCICVCVARVCVCVPACVCSYCVITEIIKLWSLHCCCHGLKCFRKYELLFLSRAKHPIWGGLTNNSWLV